MNDIKRIVKRSGSSFFWSMRLLPKAKRRSEEFMGAALLFWLKKYSDEEFCRAIGSMSYTQGLPTGQSAPAAPSVEENDTKGE